jgi:glycosyltransferase involved in cell wall biosynthesis
MDCVKMNAREIAAAQARRDRARLAEAQAQIVALETRLTVIERSLERRAGRLARRLLGRPGPGPQPVPVPVPGGITGTRGLALVIDHNWPQPDRDSGSIDIFNLVVSLDKLGFEVILAASRQHVGRQPARDWLVAQGIRCLQPHDVASVEAFIEASGHTLDLCVMCRVFAGGEALELLQRSARQARLIFNSVDLNYLREERRVALLGDEILRANLPFLRSREEHVIRSSDATLVVSEQEYQLLGETMPQSYVAQMPLARHVQPPKTGFSQRAGIGFIGGFMHAPNVDAMRSFLQDIWPQVLHALPDCMLSIVGPDAPADLAASMTNVRVLGHLPDIEPWFESLRLTVAPLRFGAGAKGKVASSLAHGVPCVATSVAAEGMSIVEGGGVLIGDTPSAFAAAIVSLYTDEVGWQALSHAGLAYAQQTLSLAAWQARLEEVVRTLGL